MPTAIERLRELGELAGNEFRIRTEDSGGWRTRRLLLRVGNWQGKGRPMEFQTWISARSLREGVDEVLGRDVLSAYLLARAGVDPLEGGELVAA